MNLLYVALTVGLPVFIAIILTVWVLSLRRVVNTNEVHITQSYNATTSFGRGMKDGNKYYQFPSWIPVIDDQKFDIFLPADRIYDKLIDNHIVFGGQCRHRIDCQSGPVAGCAALRVSDDDAVTSGIARNGCCEGVTRAGRAIYRRPVFAPLIG